MLRFFSLMIFTVAIVTTDSAKAECNPSQVWLNFEKEYNHWRDHRKNRKHQHKHQHKHHRRHCGGKKHAHRRHRSPPPPLPPVCMVCVNPNQPVALPAPSPAPLDKGFCKVENSEFRSRVFKFGDQDHLLSLVILNNELAVELVRLNKTSNVSDDDKYYASPEGFSHPAEPSHTPLAAFPELAQKESQKLTCNNTRSVSWGVDEGRVFPNFFGGRIDMVYTKDVIYTQTSLSTDLSTTAYMDIRLKRVPDKRK